MTTNWDPIISVLWSLPPFLHSNNSTWDQFRAWPTWLSTAVTCTERRALTAAWPETPTVHGMVNPAPDTPTHRRGNDMSTKIFFFKASMFDILYVIILLYSILFESWNPMTFVFCSLSQAEPSAGCKVWQPDQTVQRIQLQQWVSVTLRCPHLAHTKTKKKYILLNFLSTDLCMSS